MNKRGSRDSGISIGTLIGGGIIAYILIPGFSDFIDPLFGFNQNETVIPEEAEEETNQLGIYNTNQTINGSDLQITDEDLEGYEFVLDPIEDETFDTDDLLDFDI